MGRYSLPEAVLEVKQAAGRLIRTSTDAGVLVADSRLRPRGGEVPRLCPPRTSVSSPQVGRYLELWRASHR
ncbi:MAG: helicase C-terminal domain-containing protein [Collinsella aerofaciens]